MTEQAERNINIHVLGIYVSEDFAQALIDDVMQIFAIGEGENYKLVKDAIRNFVKVDGFRKGMTHKALPGKIRQALLELWNHIPPLSLALLTIWKEKHSDFYQKCKEWHESDPKISILGEPAIEDPEHVYEFIELLALQMLKDFPNFAPQENVEVALAIIRLEEEGQNMQDQPEKPFSSEEEIIEVKHKQKLTGWEDLIESIQEIPVNDLCWEHMEHFVESVKAISVEKLAQRAGKEQFKELEEKWQSFKQVLLEKTVYLEITGVEDWEIPEETKFNGDEFLATVQKLEESFATFDRLSEIPEAETRTKRIQREKEKQQLEENLLEMIQQLGESITATENVLPEKAVDDELQNIDENVEIEDTAPEINGTQIPEQGLPETVTELTDDQLPEVQIVEFPSEPDLDMADTEIEKLQDDEPAKEEIQPVDEQLVSEPSEKIPFTE